LCLNSNWAEAWSFSGWVKNWLGEPEAAIERFARAMRLSPLDPSLRIPSGTAHAHFFLGRYDKAASWAAMGIAGQSGLSTWITDRRRGGTPYFIEANPKPESRRAKSSLQRPGMTDLITPGLLHRILALGISRASAGASIG
jgi:hypothetical protein